MNMQFFTVSNQSPITHNTMKTVYQSNDALINAYANKDSYFGRSNSLCFERDTLYSYGTHYILSQRVFDVRGNSLYLINANKYSVTTAKHQTFARRILGKYSDVIYVNFPQNNWLDIKQDILPMAERMLIDIYNLCHDQKNAKKYTFYYPHALQELGNLERFRTRFNVKLDIDLTRFDAAKAKYLELLAK
jgi:hypothetical protein